MKSYQYFDDTEGLATLLVWLYSQNNFDDAEMFSKLIFHMTFHNHQTTTNLQLALFLKNDVRTTEMIFTVCSVVSACGPDFVCLFYRIVLTENIACVFLVQQMSQNYTENSL